MTILLAMAVVAAAGHQVVKSSDGVLSAWKGGGFGMYTTPHGLAARVTFLSVDGHALRLAPPDPGFTDWVKTVDPSSAAYLEGLIRQAEGLRTFPRDPAADRLMAAATRVIWDKDLFGAWIPVGKQPASAMVVTVLEIARRPQSGVIDSRIVYRKAGD